MKECSKCRHCYDDDVEICPVDNIRPVFTIAGSTTISGRYILERRLGQGGMGVVFRAKHKFLKSSHAVKIILPSLVDGDADLLVRFNQEAVLAASIDHPNVIRVTDFGVENDIMPFLVMEFIDGIPLSNYLTEGKPLTPKDAFDLFIPVAEGVAEAHRKGIVHRDLKPQNVMVQKNLPLKKAIKVLDFGLAKIKSPDSYPSLIQAKTMNIVGSPPYMSPEQWSGDGVDHRTDVYALAVLLYQMLAGRLPFQADTMPAMMYQHLNTAPPSATSLGIPLSPEIEAVLQKALQKDPQNRYDSMDIMLSELEDSMGKPEKRTLTGAVTEYLIPRDSTDSRISKSDGTGPTLSDSQKKRFYSYFDTQQRPDIAADPQLAKDFLEAQDRIDLAKTEAVNADQLVQELVEAQKEAEAAQDKAIRAKQRMEADVRRQVEAEMERLAVEDHAKREAEAVRLAQEVEARRVAEERANYLAQAALEAQQLAESERKKSQAEAQQRELHEGVRRAAEIETQRLAEQVAEARKQYEDAKNEAAREAQFRVDAELRQKNIESQLASLTYNEAERRKLVEASAKKYIEDQAGRFEKEALAAKQRLEEARLLIELEAQKREQAEAARIHAEGEAERLSQEIIEVQRQMQEMRQHITDSSSSGMSPHGSITDVSMRSNIPSVVTVAPVQTLFSSSQTGTAPNRKPLILVSIAIVTVLLLAGGGIGLYLLVSPPVPAPVGREDEPPPNPGPVNPTTPRVLIEGGTFEMGRDDIDNKNNQIWGDQYPAHPVPVDSIYVDQYETTNSQYADFVKDTRHNPPKYWTGENPPAGKESFPVTNVTLSDAKAYAAWISKRENRACRLPSEQEWEYAARNGGQTTSYPWGNDWRPGDAVLDGAPVAVGTSQDKTLAGVADMLGNVTEWTSDVYFLYEGHPSPQKPGRYLVIRGLNFRVQKELKELFKKTELMLTYRNQAREDEAFDYLGFRLVCTP